jgi:N-acyl amino acid synthase of PEP-CTERM/exosortase system
MNRSTLENTIFALREEVSIELADTESLIRKAQEVRHQVYCVERSFLTGQDGIERDEYDAFARHAIVRWRQTGEVVGTVRLVLPKVPATGDDYPIQHLCDPAWLRGIPLASAGEVSRFAVPKRNTSQMRQMSASSCSLLRIALIQAAVWMSYEAGHTHLLAVMEPTLIRLLRATSMHFVPLGPAVDYHGLRQPVTAELVPTLARLAAEQPVVWEFVTRNGALYPTSWPEYRRHGRAHVVPSVREGSGPFVKPAAQHNIGGILSASA